jgi:hypothetical protein
VNCQTSGTGQSFYGNCSGTFTNCHAVGPYALGGGFTASGVFNSCTALGIYSLGGRGTTSGTFNHCTAGFTAFGEQGTLTSTVRIMYCRQLGNFGTPPSGGRIRLCIDGGFVERNLG